MPPSSITSLPHTDRTTPGASSAPVVVLIVDGPDCAAVDVVLRSADLDVTQVDIARPDIERAVERADLVILDASIPDHQSMDLLQRLEHDRNGERIPVLRLATRSSPMADHAAVEARVDGYLAHPPEAAELLTMTRALVRLRRVERDLRREADRLRHTQAATTDIARATTFDDVARALHEHAAAALGASVAVLYRLGDPGGDEEPTSLYAPGIDRHGGLTDAAATCRELPLHRDTGATHAVRLGEAVWVADAAAQNAPARLVLHDGDFGSWAALPLLVGERAFGCIAVAWTRPQRHGRFDPADQEFLRGLVEQVAIALERAQFAETERQERRRTERLQRLTEALSEARTVEEVADAAVAHGTGAFGAVGTVIALLLPDGMTVELAKVRDMKDETFESWRRFPLAVPAPLTDVIRSGEPMFLESRAAWRARYPALLAVVEGEGHHANAVLPLVVDRQVIGAIGMAFDRPRSFRQERDMMVVAARQCALALERARLYEAERTARAEAEAANRAKSDFLAVMSHELRTPLNAIGGYVELLDMGIHGPVTDEQRQDYQRIQAAQRHLIGLINDVLNYVRIETGRVQYMLLELPLHETLFALHALFAPQLHAKGLTYRYEGVDPAITVRADRDKLNQILLNLLTNAIKFTDTGGSITLGTSMMGDRVLVHVRDTGLGIPHEQLDAIFEPFVQVDKRLTRTNEGVGLGLSISRDLARGMGGDLTAESTPGVGSVLTLSLPRVS